MALQVVMKKFEVVSAGGKRVAIDGTRYEVRYHSEIGAVLWIEGLNDQWVATFAPGKWSYIREVS